MAKEPFSARYTCVWMGALLFFVLKGFRGGIMRQLEPQFEKRNFWVGYFLSLVLLVIIIYVLCVI